MALMPGCSSGSSTTDSTRCPSTNTRGRRRRSDARKASPVISAALAAGAFMASPRKWSGHSRQRPPRPHPGHSGVMDLPVLHVLDFLFEMARALVQHLVGLARELPVG